MNANPVALNYFLAMMQKGKIEYRNGELWRLWELRRGWLKTPRRMEKRASNNYFMLRATDKDVGRPLYVMAHRVIWAYFYGDTDSALVINHKNGIKDDNRIENLELVSTAENIAHARLTGLAKPIYGMRTSRCKLDDDAVRSIRDLVSEGKYLQREIKVQKIIPVYAPSFENDVGNYQDVVTATVAEWRARK